VVVVVGGVTWVFGFGGVAAVVVAVTWVVVWSVTVVVLVVAVIWVLREQRAGRVGSHQR